MSKDFYDIFIKPVYSEKATHMNGISKHIFVVDKSANKLIIRRAIESVFEVEVSSVNILNQKGKVKRFKGKVGKRSDKKKAIVSLKPGHSIELVSGD